MQNKWGADAAKFMRRRLQQKINQKIDRYF